MAQGQLTLNAKLDTAAGLARWMITVSAVVPRDHPLTFNVSAAGALRLGREIEALVRLSGAADAIEARHEAAGAEIRRLHDRAVRINRQSMVMLGLCFLNVLVASVFWVLA